MNVVLSERHSQRGLASLEFMEDAPEGHGGMAMESGWQTAPMVSRMRKLSEVWYSSRPC
jgi:hypothetical protein